MKRGLYKLTKDFINVLFIWFLLLSFCIITETNEINENLCIEGTNKSDELEIISILFIFKLTFTILIATLWCNKTMIKLGIF